MAWTAPTTRATGDFITASIWNTDVVDNLSYLKTEADKLDDISVSSPSRAIATTYQNTSGKVMIVVVRIMLTSAGSGANAAAYCKIGASSPPSTVIATPQFSEGAASSSAVGIMVTFIVPPDYYYRVEQLYATATVADWSEYTLH